MYDDVCEECGEELWKPHKDFPEIMLRFVHLHEGKKVTEILKLLPHDPTLSDEESKKHGRLTSEQEWAIVRMLEEVDDSDGALLADDMGVGKTGQIAEVILRAGWTRGLVIGLPDTHDQWVERIYAQSDGAVRALVMNGTKEGRANLARFLKGEDGIYVAGSHYLVAQDFESRRVPNPARDPQLAGPQPGKPKYLFKLVKTTNHTKGLVKGQLVLRDRKEGQIGPAAEPIFETKSHHLQTFKKTGMKRHPLQFIAFDEVQAIANKNSQGRRTVRSLSAEGTFRLAASGTWFLNDPDNMFSITRWVWPGDDPLTGEQYVESVHDKWRDKWLSHEQVRNAEGEPVYTPSGRAVLRFTGEKEPGAFVESLPCYIRREASDPIPDAEIIYVDPTPQQAAQLAELKADLMTWVMNWQGEEEPLIVDIPATLHQRMRQVAIAELSLDEEGDVTMADSAASAKLVPVRGLLEKAWQGQPVAIYTDSKIGAKFIERRMRAAGVDARAWHGDLPKKQRNILKKQFLAGEFPYIIATIQSFGTGLDGFQKVCDKVIWISEADGNPALNAQAIRRFIRPGRLMRKVLRRNEVTGEWDDATVDDFTHVKIVMRDSLDEISLKNLIHKNWQVRLSLASTTAA